MKKTVLREMGQTKEREKGLFMEALEDGAKKAVEMSVVVFATGYPPKVILLASAAVFAGSFAFKAVKFRISERR